MKSPLSTILSTIIYTPLTMDCCTNYATSGITINHHWLQPLILIHHWEFPVCHVWLLKGSRGYSLIVSTFYPIQKKQVEVVVGSCDVENHWIIHPLIQWLSLFIPVGKVFQEIRKLLELVFINDSVIPRMEIVQMKNLMWRQTDSWFFFLWFWSPILMWARDGMAS